MLTSISWTTYFIIIVLLTIGWYFYIAIRYYKAEIRLLLKKPTTRASFSLESERAPQVMPAAEDAAPETKNITEDLQTDPIFATIDELILNIKNLVADLAAKAIDEETLAASLRSLLIRYPEIANSPLVTSLNELIVSECAAKGLPKLSEDEVTQLWT